MTFWLCRTDAGRDAILSRAYVDAADEWEAWEMIPVLAGAGRHQLWMDDRLLGTIEDGAILASESEADWPGFGRRPR
jgi:hypothetical protein